MARPIADIGRPSLKTARQHGVNRSSSAGTLTSTFDDLTAAATLGY
jgi:hypothetical protein